MKRAQGAIWNWGTRKRCDQDEEVLCASGMAGAFHSPLRQGSRVGLGSPEISSISGEGRPLQQGTGEEGRVPEPGEMKAPAGGKQPLERAWSWNEAGKKLVESSSVREFSDFLAPRAPRERTEIGTG